MHTQEQELVEQHLTLVRNIILGTIRLNESVSGMGYDDVYQTGCEALCHAARHYRADRGASFETFATTVIRNRLLSHCRQVNRIQFPLEYLDAPLPDSTGLTYRDTLMDVKAGHQDMEAATLSFLTEAEKKYSGITRKGIQALMLKYTGHTGVEIAARYGVDVKPNHVAAWISRARYKLRTDKKFACLWQ